MPAITARRTRSAAAASPPKTAAATAAPTRQTPDDDDDIKPASTSTPRKGKAKKEEPSAPQAPVGVAPLSASALKKQALYTAAREAGTPFPHWARPTPQEAQEVCDLLGSVHGVPERPKVLVDKEDAPAGCGQVPSVLDALVRTILSQNTSSKNSTAAKQSMDAVYGRANYRGVLDGGEAKLEDAIRCGGLSKNKSKAIIGVLNRIEERNVHEKGLKPGEGELSLDFLHGLSDDDAMRFLVSQDLVGPKTASCVLLFCLGRDSFAVDTHVHRITQSLGWLPPNGSVHKVVEGEDKPVRVTSTTQPPTRDQTFYHLDHRLPNHLKYPLHCLIVSHGRGCDRCAAGSTTQNFVDSCPIDHLVRRTKGKATRAPKAQPVKKVEGRVVKEEEGEPLEDAAEKELAPMGEGAAVKPEDAAAEEEEEEEEEKPTAHGARAKRGRAAAGIKAEQVDEDGAVVAPPKRTRRTAAAGAADEEPASRLTGDGGGFASGKKTTTRTARGGRKDAAQVVEHSVARDVAEMSGRKYTMHGLDL